MLSRKFYTIVIVGILLCLMLTGCSTEEFNQQFKELRTKVETRIESIVISPDNNTIEQEEIGSDEQPSENSEQEEIIGAEWQLEAEYFNEVKEVDGMELILNPDNLLSLVNKQQVLPDSYIPEDLIAPEVEFSFGHADVPKRYLRKEAAKALEELFAAAKDEGITLFAVSGYRSFDTQANIYDYNVRQKGEERANAVSAMPGQSEHQTGLAMDVSSKSNQFQLTEQFANTEEGKWVANNAHRYGFIIRFPKGKEHITGYNYEPWHIRFVGEKIANVIYKNDLTLEEYFERVKKI